LYVQMIGRGTRLYPGKDDCLIMDFVGATARQDLMTAATLFHVQPDNLAERGLTGAIARRGTRDQSAALPPVAGELVATPVDLFRRRSLHWVQMGDNGFVLPLGTEGWITLEPTGERWRVVRLVPDGQRACLAADLSLAYAQGVAEDYIHSQGAGGLVNPRAKWRQDPASDGQLRLMRHLGLAITPWLTKGDASDLITIAKASRVLRSGSAHQ
jgi:ATP-dependent helicase IRC3